MSLIFPSHRVLYIQFSGTRPYSGGSFSKINKITHSIIFAHLKTIECEGEKFHPQKTIKKNTFFFLLFTNNMAKI